MTKLGLVDVPSAGPRQERRCRLTDAGRELLPVVDQLGRWGQRWLAAPRPCDLDAELLLFDIGREVAAERLPERPLTVEVDIAVAPALSRWWLALTAAEVRLRRTEPAGWRTCGCVAR